MTGLDPNSDRLLEVACIVTDGQLCPVDEGVSYVIRTDESVLESMGEWCVRMWCLRRHERIARRGCMQRA